MTLFFMRNFPVLRSNKKPTNFSRSPCPLGPRWGIPNVAAENIMEIPTHLGFEVFQLFFECIAIARQHVYIPYHSGGAILQRIKLPLTFGVYLVLPLVRPRFRGII